MAPPNDGGLDEPGGASPQQAPSDPKLRASRPLAVLGLGLYFVALAVILVAAVVEVWPIATAPFSGKRSVPLVFGLANISVTHDVALIVLVIVAGATGSWLHAATSFADFTGNRRLLLSWSPGMRSGH